ncbi:hypothetical protein AAEO50_19085 [Rossellomorea oryzaecorticis]|uniref:Uncharacterized protein n=1 Tax=Rossellomorea oryzaecorticis TaxID=1396505 RepID=A0ABU9KED9_9BACI
MNILLFAAGAYLLLLPFLKFIPIQSSFKQKVRLSSLSFGVTSVALIGSQFLPFTSVLAILILLTGLMAYLVQSRLKNRLTPLHPEPTPPASQLQEPKIYETTNEHTTNDPEEETESEIIPIKDTEEDSFDEGQHDYIEELDWKENEDEHREFVNDLDHEEAAAEEELPEIEGRIPELITDPSSSIKDEEEEEYARLFSGSKR